MVAIQIRPKSNSYKLSSGWYTGNVEVTITCIATEPQMIKYTLTRGGELVQDEDPVGDEGPITFDITEEGITTITAWTIDETGNATPKKTVNAKIDKNDPERPTVLVLKDGIVDVTNETERWIGKDGKVTAAGGDERPDIGLKIAKMEYEITTGGNTKTDSKSGQIVEIPSKELGEDGAYTVKVWSVDQAGRKSAEYTEVSFNKDTTAPTDVSLEVKSIMSKTIVVEAQGIDNGGSGIYKYKFFMKRANESTYTEKETITVDNKEICKYSYKDLEKGISYNFMVEVSDKAGNITSTVAETADGTGSFIPKEWVVKVRRLCGLQTG